MEKIKVQRHYRKNHLGRHLEVRLLGNGFQEIIYHRALAHEMNIKGINYQSEVWHNIFYRDAKPR